MKEPSPRNTPIDMARMIAWTDDFTGYRYTITEQRIDRWLNQFDEDHRDIAARVLDCVDFISHEQMVQAFREILNSLEGWHRDESQRQGKWRFVAFSGSAGESGDSMLHKFRLANGLNGRIYDNLFIHRSDLLRENLGADDTIVFVDDFSGTGKQATDAWKDYLHEIMPEGPDVYLILVAASIDARDKINQETKTEKNSFNTGYSHQWHKVKVNKSFMASVDSLQEKARANAKGYRTFRVTVKNDLAKDEIFCPSDTNKNITCKTCGLCDGTRKAKNIAILVHGSLKKNFSSVA